MQAAPTQTPANQREGAARWASVPPLFLRAAVVLRPAFCFLRLLFLRLLFRRLLFRRPPSRPVYGARNCRRIRGLPLLAARLRHPFHRSPSRTGRPGRLFTVVRFQAVLGRPKPLHRNIPTWKQDGAVCHAHAGVRAISPQSYIRGILCLRCSRWGASHGQASRTRCSNGEPGHVATKCAARSRAASRCPAPQSASIRKASASMARLGCSKRWPYSPSSSSA
jgi:hypothetical protein